MTKEYYSKAILLRDLLLKSKTFKTIYKVQITAKDEKYADMEFKRYDFYNREKDEFFSIKINEKFQTSEINIYNNYTKMNLIDLSKKDKITYFSKFYYEAGEKTIDTTSLLIMYEDNMYYRYDPNINNWVLDNTLIKMWYGELNAKRCTKEEALSIANRLNSKKSFIKKRK